MLHQCNQTAGKIITGINVTSEANFSSVNDTSYVNDTGNVNDTSKFWLSSVNVSDIT
jgi:hypothetical protein